MAQIMAILCEDGRLKPGSKEYKIARKLVASRIDSLGPEAAWKLAVKSRGQILNQVRIEDMIEELKEKFPYLDY